MKQFQALTVCVMAITSAAAVVEVKGAPTTTTVTSQLQQPAGTQAPWFFSDVGQSGTDTYVTMAGRAPVNSILQGGGDWQLDTQSAARAVWLDLADSTLPWASASSTGAYLHTLLTTHCASIGAVPVASLSGVGSSTQCGMSFRINWGTNSSVFYRIHFNSVVHPGTGDVAFTCNAVASNGCVDWTARPADNDSVPADGRSIGMLVKVSQQKTGNVRETEELVGYYPVAFLMHITKP